MEKYKWRKKAERMEYLDWLWCIWRMRNVWMFVWVDFERPDYQILKSAVLCSAMNVTICSQTAISCWVLEGGLSFLDGYWQDELSYVGIGSDHSHLNQFSLSWMDGWIPHCNFLIFIFFSNFLFLNVFNYIQNEYNL